MGAGADRVSGLVEHDIITTYTILSSRIDPSKPLDMCWAPRGHQIYEGGLLCYKRVT